MNSKTLSLEHKKAWVSFFVAHGRITRQIDDLLKKAGRVSLDVYDVLLTLEMAPEGKLIMSDLADRVLITRSGMTRMTDRLEKLGLLKRKVCLADRRALYVSLTPLGLEERQRAWVVYEQGIIDLFADHLSLEEASQIDYCLERFSQISINDK